MNIYLNMLEADINKVHELSRVCRGGWCRLLESEVDMLQDELRYLQIHEADFARTRVARMSAGLRDAYRHLQPAAPP